MFAGARPGRRASGSSVWLTLRLRCRGRSGRAGPPTRGSCCRRGAPARSLCPFGSVAVSTAPAWKPFSDTSSQWPTGPVSSSRTSGPPIVLIAIAIRPLLSKSAGARPRPMIFGSPVRVDDPARVREPAAPGRPWSTWSGSVSCFRFVTGIAPLARIRSRLPLFWKSTNAVAPADRRLAARAPWRTSPSPACTPTSPFGRISLW